MRYSPPLSLWLCLWRGSYQDATSNEEDVTQKPQREEKQPAAACPPPLSPRPGLPSPGWVQRCCCSTYLAQPPAPGRRRQYGSMAAQKPALFLLLMVGMWASCRHRGAALGPGEPTLRLSGGGCRCTGLLEVQMWSRWSPVCWDGVSQDSVCQQLDCGPPTKLSFMPPDLEDQQAWAMRCKGLETCHWVAVNCSQQAIVACSEPEPTRTEPPPVPPTTSPEPTGAPWLRLVDGNFSCSGFVELHLRGRWGAVALSPDVWPELPTRICHALGCNNPSGIPIGVAVGDTTDIPIGVPIGDPARGPMSLPPQSRLPVRWEAVVPCTSPELLDCFSWTSHGHRKASTFLICPGSQPRAGRRLAGGPTPCEGHIEVFQRGHWHMLCDEQVHRVERSRQLCRELRCGDLSFSTELRDSHASGIICKERYLHLCPESSKEVQGCSRTHVVCQKSKPPPAGTAPGTVASICLALLLLGVLLLICGPPAYRRLMKKISKKKQRQWIGPTGLHQSVSFHRNSTVTPRARVEEQRAQGRDNDYAQPPQKSLLAYPALEGTARASSALDNSSDSDYDLHSARRL
ncbi:T-cell surface glycoprotein CD5 isoform X2 [Meleagris gallopavo]|uniref:T-cell surface glycoprotein CD5 isoform X2 n=1 Tax=Meleagris gallopavo TaxID=9103 RepID=UPI000549AFDD|nr:T-cell surface glycoprotein CD5 isoform X2 [Meleagris gallopavo]